MANGQIIYCHCPIHYTVYFISYWLTVLHFAHFTMVTIRHCSYPVLIVLDTQVTFTYSPTQCLFYIYFFIRHTHNNDTLGAIWSSVSYPWTLWHMGWRSWELNQRPSQLWLACSESWGTAAHLKKASYRLPRERHFIMSLLWCWYKVMTSLITIYIHKERLVFCLIIYLIFYLLFKHCRSLFMLILHTNGLYV